MNLFSQAAKNLPLSPAARAALRFIEGLALSCLAAGVTAAAPYVLVGPSETVNWHQVLTVFLTGFGMTLFQTIKKYFTAHADAPLDLQTSTNQQVNALMGVAAPASTGDAT